MLRGERITLRPIEREDLRRICDLKNNVELMQLAYGSWQPVPFAQFEKEFDKNLEKGEHNWMAIETEGKIVGEIGLHHIHRGEGVAAFGIGIYDADYLGKGYGREALTLFLDWCFRIQNFRRIWLDTLATNERAIRSYLACGFVEEGRQRQAAYYDGAYVDMVMMGILRPEWEARQKVQNLNPHSSS